MLSKTIKYVDYDGKSREETFFFHLSEAELAELEMTTPGGFQNYVARLVREENAPEMVALWKKMLLMAYGEKSQDGRRFIKSERLATEFTQTPAYSILFMELSTSAEAAAAFVNGVVPKSEKVGLELAERSVSAVLTEN